MAKYYIQSFMTEYEENKRSNSQLLSTTQRECTGEHLDNKRMSSHLDLL